ncbi:MAG: hypothetical protein QOD07_171 [Frankiaceae bacterium]|nr:hypothetical protein [Frankiaceae bacterium]
MDLATTLATIVLAIAALGSLVLTCRALRLTRIDVQQSRYARIDARSPRVIVRSTVEPVFPACGLPRVVTAVEARIPAGTRLDMPGSAATQLGLACYVELFNEGSATAFIDLPRGAIRVSGDGIRPDETDPDLMRWRGGHRLNTQLAPGEACWLLMEGWRDAADWVRLYQFYSGDIWEAPSTTSAADVPGHRFDLDVRDQFAEGICDLVTVDVLGLPLTPLPGADSSWQVTGPVFTPFTSPKTAVQVRETLRDYPTDRRH